MCPGPACAIGNARTGASSARRSASISGSSGNYYAPPVMDAISVTARRGDVVEAVHRVHAVAVRDGEILATAGNGELVCYLRSSAKPIQAHQLVRAYADVDEASGVSDHATAIDGCGVPCFAMPLPAMARLLTRAEARVARAMRARPELVGGTGAPDTELMRALRGWIAKGGAEGLFCAAAPDGTGVALKIEDGSFRGMKPALHRFFLDALGVE